MTKLDYFNLLIQTSKERGFPSLSHHDGCTTCSYRGVCGRKCAVGLLIPDDRYSSHLEGLAADSIMIRDRIDIPEGMSMYDLCACQEVHDAGMPRMSDLISDLIEMFGSKEKALEKANEYWDHGLFVQRLLKLECFLGFTPVA